MKPQKTIRLTYDEQGFASIVIALVLIVILGLLSVGFAQLARREQQSALDKQLSTQAYYAAESGINDTVKDINSGAINSSNASSTNCMTAPSLPTNPVGSVPAALTANPNVNPSGGVSYSCLLVSLKTSSLVFGDTPPGAGQFLSFSTSAPLQSLTIQWGSFDKSNNPATLPSPSYPAGAQFPNFGTWNSANYLPLLQFSLSPTNSGGAISRAGLIDNTFNTYLYPATNSGSYSVDANKSTDVGWDLNNQGQIVPGNCGKNGSSTYPCSVTLTGAALTAAGTSFVMHYLDFYDASNVYITGTAAPGGGSVTFTGQVLIDVTGKAHNVLKRLQVRLNADGANGKITDSALLPDNALQGKNACKRLQTAPVLSTNPNGTNYIDPGGGTSSTDPCFLNAP